MDLDTFLTIAFLALFAISYVGYRITREIAYVEKREKRYVRGSKK